MALRPLCHLYGHTLAKDSGSLPLKAVREEMIRADLCRNEVNKQTSHIIRAFEWAVENELVPPSVHLGLKSLRG